ncbi:MAG: type II secretion system protein GspG [Phycisphaerales bacterium]|nr:MAG: type II secretion system protein GspG [Phycisphaerales bacterium]
MTTDLWIAATPPARSAAQRRFERQAQYPLRAGNTSIGSCMKDPVAHQLHSAGRNQSCTTLVDRFRKPAARRGLTLVEILAVVIILGLLAATLVVGFSGSFGKARHEIARSNIGIIVSKLETYRMHHGNWPSNDVGLKALSDGYANPSAAYYLGPGSLIDPWGNPYLYVTPGPDGHPYEVLSYGADGQPGGTPGTEDEPISSVNLRNVQQSE